MTRLSFQDNTSVLMETAVQKHHITGLFVLKKPKDSAKQFVSDIVESLRGSDPVAISLRSKLKHSNPSLNQEYGTTWEKSFRGLVQTSAGMARANTG